MLVIASDADPVYVEHKKVWSTYMNSNPAIESYFIQYRDGLQDIEGNTFWLTGEESLPGILHKTLDSFDYFLKKDKYDFIIRTNLSSVWNFHVLLKYLETLPKENVYNGIIGDHKGIPFISGSGFIMSLDVAKLLLENRKIAEQVNIIDDVDIGYTLNTLGVPLTLGKRAWPNTASNCLYDKDTYHYRVVFYNNRNREPEKMKELLKQITDINAVTD